MALDLFAHNQKAYAAAVEMLSKYGKAAIVHPTGMGKSIIAFQLVEDHPDAVVLWLSPSEYIFKTQIEAAQRVDPLFDGKSIRFYTYAKLTMFSEEELAQIAAEKPAYIILDELHRAGAPCWQKPVETLLRLCPEAKLLGLTATNIRYLDNNRDMTEELFDGCIASEMTLGEAIVRGILPAPKYVTTVFRYQNELAKYQQCIDNTRAPGTEEQNQQYLDALRRALEQADGLDKVFVQHMTNKSGKYIVFCANLEHMNEMIAHVPEWFTGVNADIHIYRAYSDDPETSKAFAKFKADESGTLKLLFCIDMLNVGIHVKGVSGVILFRPTISPIIFKQQIGRALTSSDSTTPLILDVVNNIENLYSIDPLQEEMQTAVQRLYANGEGEQIVTERFEVIEQVRDCRKLFDQLENSLSNTWEQYYAAASAYYAEHGNLNVPKSYVTLAGLSLGNWIITQRKVRAGKANGCLTEQKIARLDQIGMVWENRLELAWERGYQAAAAYYKRYGDLLVPAQYKDENGYAIGAWITNLRTAYANGERQALLTEERIAALEGIGMQWSAISSKWERSYAEAAVYYERNGNLHVPVDYKTADGFFLGHWLANMHQARQGNNRARLDEHRVHHLDMIGMEWGNRNKNQWQRGYAEAKRYYDKNGNLNIPASYITPSGMRLGKWVRRQQDAYCAPDKTNAKLTAERIDLLERIGMVWQREDPWEHRFALLREYKEKHGALNVPLQYKTADGVRLGKWLYLQRDALSKEKLTAEQRNKLLSLGVAPQEERKRSWSDNYAIAQNYFKANGSLDMPRSYTTAVGEKIGAWLYNQKIAYRDGLLDAEKIRLLESLRIQWGTGAQRKQTRANNIAASAKSDSIKEPEQQRTA